MGHRDLLVTHNLSERKYHHCSHHPRGSVRRASGFVLTGNPEVATSHLCAVDSLQKDTSRAPCARNRKSSPGSRNSAFTVFDDKRGFIVNAIWLADLAQVFILR